MPDAESHPKILTPNSAATGLIERRSFIKKSALWAGGVFFIASRPEAIAGVQPANTFEKEYILFLHRLRLRNISVADIYKAHQKQRGTVKNTLPPKSMWRNIGPTLKVADATANVLRCRVTAVTSVYRSPAYNARCPGARRGSMHTRNLAIDIQYEASPSQVAAALRRLRDRGAFRGGVGRYARFVHLDTRGENLDW